MAAILPWIRENICQNEPFPLYGGWLSPCLQDVAIYLVLDIFLLVFGLYRIIHLRKHYEKVPDLPTTNIHLLKNSTHIFIIILVITEIAIHQFRGTWGPYYDIVKDVGNVIVWIFSMFVLHSEYRRGCRQNWILRTWWTLSFLGWSVTLKYAIDVGLPKVDFGLLIAEYTFVTLMCFVGLFFNRIPVVASQEDQTHYGTFAGSNLSRKYEMCDDDEMEGEEDSGGPTRELSANFISKSLFWWMNGLLKLGFKRPLQQADLQDLHPDDEANALSREFQEIWEKERQEKKPSIKRALRKFVQKKFFFTGFFKFGNDVFVFTGPLVLNGILSFLSNNDPMWVVWTCGLFLGSCLQSLFSNQYFFRGYRIGMHMRNALIAAVYQKSFKLSNSARQQSTTGEIVNLQAIDSQKMADLMPFLHMVWSAPFQIGVAITWLIFILGPSALAGLGVMVLLIPFNVLLARKQGKLQKEIMKIKDARAKRMNEILNGIRVVKFFVWEPSMSDSIQEIRTKELKLLRHSAYLRAGTIFLWTSTPLLVAVATFTAYTLTGHPLTPSVAFTSLALFNILRFPLNMLPNVISSMVEAGVSLGRIQTFLLNEELDTNATIFEKDHKNPALTMENGSFAWDKNKEKKSIQALDNVNFKVNQGELVAIIAPVGIGKSSLMAAMLGDMEKLNGTVKISGSVAYVSQQAWIQNATVRDNILFGREFDGDRYNATLEACELLPDIQVLPDGDMTEIGEKGINLSGGQKQRINCARAVYQMADIYLFDDPLSAVDAHVGRNLFNNCIKGMLQGKTRVLVTHQLQYLSEVDRILVLKETSYGGTVAEFGTYQELMARSNDFTKIIRDHVLKEQEKQERQEDNQPALTESSAETQFTNAQGANVNTSNTGNIKLEEEMPRKRKQKQTESPKDDEKAALKNTPKKLMTVEERRVGQIGATTYKQYLSAFPGGMAVGAIIILMFVCSQASSIGSNVWLAQWSDNAEEAEKKVFFYLGIYAAIGLSSPVFVIIRSFLVALCGLGAAKKFHEKMLGSAMRAPVSFFDTTPIGRILNRFTKDIADVDQMVPPTLMQFMEMAFSVLGIIVVISMATPWFLVPLVPLAYFYRYIQRYYVSSSRELKRLDSISKSPIFAHFSETLSGLSIIRAYKRVSVFVNENEHKLNENAKAYFTLFASNRWLGIRLEFIGYSVVTLAALFAVFSKGSINPGVAGLAVSLGLTALLNMAVRMSAEVENQLVSVERVMEYTSLTSEAPAESTRDVPEDWPSDGRIEFENVSMRYRPDLPLVLKHVSFTINPQEKVGIVGRTGSGKSSTVLALFRIVELLEGSVVIDGVDIRSLGLNDARSRLSIIPQDPVLFTGTVRSNVDPTESYSEPEIWKALESVHMKHAVEILPMKIDSPVTEAGENFSVGQRQLLCLARALLKRSKVIVMDEATAAVDMQTDSLIQNTIRTQFSGMTVITIAHRIHTILDYDKIAVMESGEVVEFDSPKELLAQSNSLFSSLVRESQRS